MTNRHKFKPFFNSNILHSNFMILKTIRMHERHSQRLEPFLFQFSNFLLDSFFVKLFFYTELSCSLFLSALNSNSLINFQNFLIDDSSSFNVQIENTRSALISDFDQIFESSCHNQSCFSSFFQGEHWFQELYQFLLLSENELGFSSLIQFFVECGC